MPPRIPSAVQALRDLLTAHALEAADLDAQAMRELRPLLAAARDELNRDLAAWMAAGKAGDRWTPQSYRSSMLALEASMTSMDYSLTTGLASILGRHDAIARALANTHTARELLRFAQAEHIDAAPTVPLKVASILVSGRHAPMERYQTSAARYAGQVGKDIRRELAIGVLRGETNDQLIARLARHGGPRGLVALRGIAGTVGAITEVIPEGLFARYDYWGERIVRTELAHAYNEQIQDIRAGMLADFPDLVRRWDSTADGRTCARCQEMSGRTSDPKTDRFPGDVDVPLHPNCRCRAGLWRPDWARLVGEDLRGTPSVPDRSPSR